MRKLRRKDRKQLAQGHMEFEPRCAFLQILGLEWSHGFSSVTQTLLQDALERSICILTQMMLLLSLRSGSKSPRSGTQSCAHKKTLPVHAFLLILLSFC